MTILAEEYILIYFTSQPGNFFSIFCNYFLIYRQSPIKNFGMKTIHILFYFSPFSYDTDMCYSAPLVVVRNRSGRISESSKNLFHWCSSNYCLEISHIWMFHFFSPINNQLKELLPDVLLPYSIIY